jgi:hypothetical protein
MPRKKPHWEYDEDAIAKAMLEVTEKRLSQKKSAQKWGVPRTTLSDRLGGQEATKDQIQPNQHLSRNQETYLVSWILR